MRRDQMEKRMSKYTHTTVRIVFPDRLVLQGVFKKYETGMCTMYNVVLACTLYMPTLHPLPIVTTYAPSVKSKLYEDFYIYFLFLYLSIIKII